MGESSEDDGDSMGEDAVKISHVTSIKFGKGAFVKIPPSLLVEDMGST